MFYAFRSCLGPLTCICIMFEGDVKMEPVEPLTSFTITKRLALISVCSDKEDTCTLGPGEVPESKSTTESAGTLQ